MKHLKILGLAAIAAIGVMALAGAGTASATTLFTSSNLTNPYPVGTSIYFAVSGGTIMFKGSGGETLDTCDESSFRVKISSASGTTVSGNIENTTWTVCTTTTDVVANGSLAFELIGSNWASVKSSGMEVTIKIFGVSCTYGTGFGTTLGTMTGGANPGLTIAAIGLTKTGGGFLCPSSVGLEGNDFVYSPHAVYFGS